MANCVGRRHAVCGNLRPIDNAVAQRFPVQDRVFALLAFAVVALCLFYRLGYLPLIQPDEGRNTEVAREMKDSGAWLIPTYHGVTYLDKPAFFFRAVALSMACFGETEGAARLVSTLSAMTLLTLTYLFCRHLGGGRLAAAAVVVIGTSPLFIAYARVVIFDMMLTLFVCAAVFAGYLAEEAEGRARRNWYLASAAAAGLATLVKGPVGFLIPLLVLGVFNWREGRRRLFRRFFAPPNLLMFLALVLPWFLGVVWLHRDFLYYGLVEESLLRFTTAKFQRSQPVYFYAVIVALTFFPWSLVLAGAGFDAWRSRWKPARIDRLCLVWAVVVVIFFSLSRSKMPGYILSAAVAAGILVARVFAAAWARTEGRPFLVVRASTLAMGTVIVGLATLLVAGAVQPTLIGGLGERVRIIKPYWTPILVTLLVVAGLLGLAWRRRSIPFAFASFALFPVLIVTVGAPAFGASMSWRSGRGLAAALPPLPATTELAYLECLPNGVPFYLKRLGTLITKDGGELRSNYALFRLREQSANWPSGLVRLDELDAWLASRQQPVFLITFWWDRPRLESIATPRQATVQELTPEYVGALLPAPGGN